MISIWSPSIQFQTHRSFEEPNDRYQGCGVDWRAAFFFWSKTVANPLNRPCSFSRREASLNCPVMKKMPSDCLNRVFHAQDNNAKRLLAVIRACTELVVLRQVVTPSARRHGPPQIRHRPACPVSGHRGWLTTTPESAPERTGATQCCVEPYSYLCASANQRARLTELPAPSTPHPVGHPRYQSQAPCRGGRIVAACMATGRANTTCSSPRRPRLHG